jgi:L-asparaginase II
MPSQDPFDNSQYQEVLVSQTRFSLETEKPLVENRHWGWVSWCDSTGHQEGQSAGAAHIATFIRSAAKPFQALPLLLTGAVESMSSEALAISCASHTGTEAHVRVVEELLQKARLGPANLQCGADWPVDPVRRRKLRQIGKPASSIYHNCSGKHAGMLFCCQQNGWPIETYLDPEHPLQKMILKTLLQATGLTSIPLATDGCGAPVFYLPLSAMARLYAQLGSDVFFAPLREAMTKHPNLVGGPGRVDTAIMQTSGGRIVAKVGADGVLCVANSQEKLGLALKIADGDARIRNFALVETLCRLGWLTKEETEDSRLTIHREARRLNSQGKEVGNLHLHFNEEG